jgi:hypothetical protein
MSYKQGTLLNAILVAIPLWAITKDYVMIHADDIASAMKPIQWMDILVFASLIAAVDPIAVRHDFGY